MWYARILTYLVGGLICSWLFVEKKREEMEKICSTIEDCELEGHSGGWKSNAVRYVMGLV